MDGMLLFNLFWECSNSGGKPFAPLSKMPTYGTKQKNQELAFPRGTKHVQAAILKIRPAEVFYIF